MNINIFYFPTKPSTTFILFLKNIVLISVPGGKPSMEVLQQKFTTYQCWPSVWKWISKSNTSWSSWSTLPALAYHPNVEACEEDCFYRLLNCEALQLCIVYMYSPPTYELSTGRRLESPNCQQSRWIHLRGNRTIFVEWLWAHAGNWKLLAQTNFWKCSVV